MKPSSIFNEDGETLGCLIGSIVCGADTCICWAICDCNSVTFFTNAWFSVVFWIAFYISSKEIPCCWGAEIDKGSYISWDAQLDTRESSILSLLCLAIRHNSIS